MRFFRRKQSQPTSLATADPEEAAKAEGFTSADHKRASEAGKKARQRRTPADGIARAKDLGMVARAEYLAPVDEAQALKPGADGLIDAELKRVRDRLLVVSGAGWVNPRSRTAYRAGLHTFKVTGAGYYEAAIRAGRFTPGAEVRLVREPDNPHDPNAIAVFAGNARAKAGYVPKAQAKRLASLMDGGTTLVAISTRGASAGREGTVPQILVCEQRLMAHLRRNL